MKETELTLDIILSYNMEKENWKPDYDDAGYLFTLPGSGLQLSTMTLCCGEPTSSDSLEGLDGYIYITTKEELETIINMSWDELMEKVASEDEKFNVEDY